MDEIQSAGTIPMGVGNLDEARALRGQIAREIEAGILEIRATLGGAEDDGIRAALAGVADRVGKLDLLCNLALGEIRSLREEQADG